MFLQVSVILLTGGSASVHAGIPSPPRADTHPTGADPPTPSGADPSEQTHTPSPEQTPSSRHPPSAEHAGRYGQRASGTHPTGMQSCFSIISEWH